MYEKWKQAFIEHQEREYKSLWDNMMKQLVSGDSENCFWLQGHANYIFRTNGVCWGMDLAFRNPVLFRQLKHRIKDDLSCLEFILLTHDHRDHLDMELIQCLSDVPVRWVIPDFLDKEMFHAAGLPEERIVWVKPGQKMDLGNVEIIAFEGLHWDDGGPIGRQALGYFVDTGARRILFPGDVRDYSPKKLPFFEGVDSLFAHVWLGREQALNFPWDRYLNPFCVFMLSAKAKKIYLTHLYDTGRPLTDLWTHSHCGPIMDEIFSMNPEVEIEIPKVGKRYYL